MKREADCLPCVLDDLIGALDLLEIDERVSGEVVAEGWRHEEVDTTFAEKGMAFMERHRAQRGDDPFFLYLPHTMLHNPLGVSESFRGTSDFGEYNDAFFNPRRTGRCRFS